MNIVSGREFCYCLDVTRYPASEIRFDTLAGMGRLAEEDQAQTSRDEFVSPDLNPD
jgi:hypothetical protein